MVKGRWAVNGEERGREGLGVENGDGRGGGEGRVGSQWAGCGEGREEVKCSEISLPYANILDNFNFDFNSKCSHI